ncbi:hypothetical protein [Streptomyces sp. NPDC006012]|uniref:hypothetical protein n=1 Tax=Streptomyces sp. NPDC006012 TaxID=3364739 RepID=UPI0036776500
MSSGHRTMTLFVTVILGLIAVILGLTVHWPIWVWPVSAALLLIVAAVVQKILTTESAPATPEPPVTGEDPQHRVLHVALPSSVADYDFSFSATVLWQVVDTPEEAPPINPAALAVDAVLQRARAVTAQQPPHHSALAQHQLDAVLATMRKDTTGRIMAMAHDVALRLPEHDRERLVKLSNVRKDEDVWEHERNYERNKRAYLSEDVLKDTGSAVVWWLSRNEEEVDSTVGRIGMLAQLSAAANNETVAPPFEHLVAPPWGEITDADQGFPAGGPHRQPYLSEPPPGTGSASDDAVDSFLAWFGFSADDPDVTLFTERLAKLAAAHGKSEMVDALQRRFAFDQPEPEDDEPPQGEDFTP